MNYEFDKIEKYAVIKGEKYTTDRCLLITILGGKNKKLTLCADELENQIHVCQINSKVTELKDRILVQGLLNSIEAVATTTIYTAEDEEEYRDYLENTKPQSDCCSDCSECLNFECYNN